VILSDDHGQTWTPLIFSDSDVSSFSVTVSEDGTRLFVIDPSSGQIYISNDDGESWTSSSNPDGYPWIFVVPSATGNGIVASAISNVSDEHDGGFWSKTYIYSSNDNGATWTKQAESNEIYLGDSFDQVLFEQLIGNISGSYNLSHLGQVTFSELFTITREESTLPEVVEDSNTSRSRSGSIHYGCKDETALNYERFSRHKQSLCIYGASPTVSTTSIAVLPPSLILLPTRDLQISMTGEDVMTLQKFLNANGYILASAGAGSPGNETTMFGALTQRALAKYQAAHNISPAIGYFGPITRAEMKASSLSGAWW